MSEKRIRHIHFAKTSPSLQIRIQESLFFMQPHPSQGGNWGVDRIRIGMQELFGRSSVRSLCGSFRRAETRLFEPILWKMTTLHHWISILQNERNFWKYKQEIKGGASERVDTHDLDCLRSRANYMRAQIIYQQVRT
jgi:hypothetical protein